ncbi:MAG: CotH kinase family protein [Anaerolineaceae bacterium]|nr:MAG: CotH kinase family protein [Anaerolineaceae bacterium]
MDLKHVQRTPWLRDVAAKHRPSRTKRILSILLGILLVFVLLAFGAYRAFEARNELRTRLFEPIAEVLSANPLLIPKHMIQGLTANPEQIVIDIKHEDFMKIAYQREIALANGYLVKGQDDFVNAKIRYNDRSIKVDMRLKGDFTDHLQGDKWSFRVRVDGNETLFGMKEFSIHHPRTRNYVYEWLFLQTLKREGVVAPRYDFINVVLNGKDLGVYALEEHFEKRLIENNHLREGPIIRFNENLLWDERFQQHRPFPDAAWNGTGLYLSSDIDAFGTGKILADPVSYAQYENAVYLLESFRRGELETSEVFDVQKLAKYFAISDLMGAQHSSFWHNMRFYYNPVTSRLEPVGFDGDSGRPIDAISPMKDGVFIGHDDPEIHKSSRVQIFDDPVFFEGYIRELERVAERSYLDTLLTDLNDELEDKLSIVYREFPQVTLSREQLYRNQEYIRTVLDPVKGLHAHYSQADESQLELELGNIHALPIEVLGVTSTNGVSFMPAQRIILPGKLLSRPVDFLISRFQLPPDFVWSETMIPDLKVDYRILGANQLRQETVFPWSYLADKTIEDDFLRQEPNVDAFDFLLTDEAAKEILIAPGAWHLQQSLIIPDGYRVIAGPGTQLDLADGAKILSYSPLEFRGDEELPVIIRSSDSTGQGLIVLNAEQRSVLDYVLFENLANPTQSGWEVTGAVTFYESPVDITRSKFIDNRSEDALNFIRSDFTVDDSFFKGALSDAIDSDFSSGEIANSSFVTIGNDAIDTSGSVVEVHDVFISNAGDKGVSAGENSQMTANRIEIVDSEIGVASKDLSTVILEDVNITGGHIGFTVYQKKPEFGAASIEVTGLELTQVDVPYLIEAASEMIIDDDVIEANGENIDDMLYGVNNDQSPQ